MVGGLNIPLGVYGVQPLPAEASPARISGIPKLINACHCCAPSPKFELIDPRPGLLSLVAKHKWPGPFQFPSANRLAFVRVSHHAV